MITKEVGRGGRKEGKGGERTDKMGGVKISKEGEGRQMRTVTEGRGKKWDDFKIKKGEEREM